MYCEVCTTELAQLEQNRYRIESIIQYPMWYSSR